MMTLEEVWGNLRQDPEIKPTIEEAEKSYKLFKKIENLIVTDLEAKLAESEKRVIELSDGIRKLEEVKDSKIKGVRDFWMKRYEKQLKQQYKEINQLKQQLAEKDSEIEDYKKMHWNMQYQHLHELDELSKLTAIDELEKVKDYIREFVGINDVKFICTTTITNQIDQQIKSLKGEKDGKI